MLLQVRKIVQEGSFRTCGKLPQRQRVDLTQHPLPTNLRCLSIAAAVRACVVRDTLFSLPVRPLARPLSGVWSRELTMQVLFTQPYWEQKLRIIILTAATFIALC